MKTIMLVCEAGMSTSLLVKKMQTACENQGEEFKIFAVPYSQVALEVESGNIDIIMVGPQVRFKEKELKEKYEPNIIVTVIETIDYGMMNGENVFNKALQLLSQK